MNAGFPSFRHAFFPSILLSCLPSILQSGFLDFMLTIIHAGRISIIPEFHQAFRLSWWKAGMMT